MLGIGKALAFLWIPLSFLHSQTFNFEEEWRWAHFTTEHGLPSNQANQIIEANDGTIWVRTTNGIAWFDGYHWINVSSLPSATITGISHSKGDSVIVQYIDTVYVGNRSGFKPLKINIDIFKVVVSNEEYLILDHRFTLHKFSHDTLIHYRSPAFYLMSERKNKVWFIADSGLYKRTLNGDFQLLQSKNNYFVVNDVDENINGSGLLAISRPMEHRGIWEWDSSQCLLHNKTENGNSVVTLSINNNGDAICVYQSGDVRIRENRTWANLNYIPEQIQHSDNLLFSSTGDLWSVTKKGVYLFRASATTWSYLSENTPDLRNNINEILLLKNNDLWLGTGNGLIIYSSSGDKRWIPQINGTPLHAVTGLEQDIDGNIWISSGSTFHGAFQSNGRHWNHFEIGNDPSNTMIHKIRKDHKGNLWFLGLQKISSSQTENEPGVFLYKNSTFTPWAVQYNLPQRRVYSFAEGLDDAIWFATAKGIFRWKLDNDIPYSQQQAWTRWFHPELHWGRVFTITIDQQNTVWFGDQDFGSGLGKISPLGTVEYLTTNDGLIDNHVNDLFIDSSGTLWITTNGGLCSYNNGVWNIYGEKSGLTCPILWPVKAYGDKIYVGTSGKGLAILDRKTAHSPPPRIIMNQPVIDDASVLLRWQTFAFRGELPSDAIHTRHRLNNGAWSSWTTNRSLTFSNLEPNSYTFQVQARGVYGQYLDIGSHVSFVVLPPLWARPIFFIPVGITALAFLFLVAIYINKKIASDAAIRKSEEKFRAVAETTPSALFIYNRDSILYANPAAVLLTGFSTSELLAKNFPDLLHPKFRNGTNTAEKPTLQREVKLVRNDDSERWINFTTKEISFEGMPATLVAVFDITELKLSEMQLRALSFELSRTEERERRRLATYLHDTISQNLAFLKLRFRTLTKTFAIPNEHKQLHELKNIIESLIADSQTLTFELSPPILNELGLKAALDWLCEKTEEQHGIRCRNEFDSQGQSLPYELQRMVFNALRELMTNAVKHADASEITLTTQVDDSTLTLTVTDNGKGITTPPQLAQSSRRGGGFGLVNIRQWVATLGGSLQLCNEENKGARVTITLPKVHIFQAQSSL